jgi:hypothetical protein
MFTPGTLMVLEPMANILRLPVQMLGRHQDAQCVAQGASTALHGVIGSVAPVTALRTAMANVIDDENATPTQLSAALNSLSPQRQSLGELWDPAWGEPTLFTCHHCDKYV